jgi:hypothetical protein
MLTCSNLSNAGQDIGFRYADLPVDYSTSDHGFRYTDLPVGYSTSESGGSTGENSYSPM